MLTIIIDLTDENEMIALDAYTYELWRKKLTPEEADFYRKELEENIMVRTYVKADIVETIGAITITTSSASVDDSI